MSTPTAAAPHGPALVVRGPGDIALEPRTGRAPTPFEVQVIPHYVGICGTDLEIIEGSMDPDYVTYPVVLGHEWAGRVAAIGNQVTRVRVGDPVVVEGIIPDLVCDACRRGATNLCQHYDELGFVRDGAAGPSVTTAQHLVHRLDTAVPLEAGALIEPASVVLRGLSEMELRPGGEVLIIGDGTVGLLTAALVSLWSPGRVVLAGRRAAQADLARLMGAEEFLTDAPPPRSFDLVVEAAGHIDAVATAFGAARRGGQILLLGISGHGTTLPLSTDDLVNNDLRVRGSFGYTAAAWSQTTRLLNQGRFNPLPVITHRFPITDYEQALATLRTSSDLARGKVLLELISR